MSATHTPTPWRVGADLTGICVERRDEHGNSTPEAFTRNGWAKTIAKMTHGSWAPVNEHVANAHFIVRAVNCHDELLEALVEVRRVGDDKMAFRSEWAAAVRKADAAIAKALRRTPNEIGEEG